MKPEGTGFNLKASYMDLPGAFYTVTKPATFKSPKLLLLNHELAESIGLNLSSFSEEQLAEVFCGNLLLEGTQPFSQAYAGHQFGHFTNLGDGRAHMLGEQISPSGERLDLQLKGSGRTPYSRGGDGLAALGPMVREYLISEAMHALGIPTTRSLAVITTGENIIREQPLPGAVLTRVASSHIRIGTFEYAAALQNPALLPSLLDYTRERHYPELEKGDALRFLEAVMKRQISLLTHWMRVGFIHGVMNTDNMALSGESLDFGPCAFLDTYNAGQVFSSIDRQGRYAYGHQPYITHWNLTRLAESLLPLIHKDQEKAIEEAQALLSTFSDLYHTQWLTMMRKKLGLASGKNSSVKEDEALITDLLDWMQRHNADFTNTFNALTPTQAPSGDHYMDDAFRSWHTRYEKRRFAHGQTKENSILLMESTNPTVIPRNHLVEKALEEAASGNLSFFNEFLTVLKSPYATDSIDKKFQVPPPPSARKYQTYCGT